MTRTKIEFRGSSAAPTIAARVARGLADVLESLPVEPTSARVTFTDENGPKGGNAIRCAVEVRFPGRPPVHVEDVASTPRLALDAGLAKLARRLRRIRESTREARRRPKKYYAARRALAAG
jgi:ribosome-associated translation inhibitor RaiA